jgi:hypothetical protein
LKNQVETLLDYQYTLNLKMKGRREKQTFSGNGYQRKRWAQGKRE